MKYIYQHIHSSLGLITIKIRLFSKKRELVSPLSGFEGLMKQLS